MEKHIPKEKNNQCIQKGSHLDPFFKLIEETFFSHKIIDLRNWNKEFTDGYFFGLDKKQVEKGANNELYSL